jgi:hypothetical protein
MTGEQKGSEKRLLVFDSTWRLVGDVVDHPIDPPYLVDDASADAIQQLPIEPGEVRGHRID